MVAALALLIIFVVAGLLWIFLFRPMREDLDESCTAVKNLAEHFTGLPVAVQNLSHDLHALIARQNVMLEEVVLRLDKAADRAFFTSNRLADDLVDREERVDAAVEGVATDLAASQLRADEAAGEPGAAADAAALPPHQDPE